MRAKYDLIRTSTQTTPGDDALATALEDLQRFGELRPVLPRTKRRRACAKTGHCSASAMVYTRGDDPPRRAPEIYGDASVHGRAVNRRWRAGRELGGRPDQKPPDRAYASLSGPLRLARGETADRGKSGRYRGADRDQRLVQFRHRAVAGRPPFAGFLGIPAVPVQAERRDRLL